MATVLSLSAHPWACRRPALAALQAMVARWGAGSGAGASAAVCAPHGSRTLFGQSFEVGTLEVSSRGADQTGTRKSKRLRDAKLVPSVLYGPDGDGVDTSMLLTVNRSALMHEVNARGPALENTLYQLVVDGKPMDGLVLPRQYDVVPAHEDQPLRVNFLRYNPGRRPGTRISIPFKAINEDKCQGVKDGGWLMFTMYSLPVLSYADTIPNCITVDLRGKRIGDKIRVSELYLNSGLLLRTTREDDFAVAKIMGSKRLASAVVGDVDDDDDGDE